MSPSQAYSCCVTSYLDSTHCFLLGSSVTTFAADTSDAAASFLSNEMYVCASNRACTYVLISGFGGMYMGGMPGMGMDGGELLQRRTYSHTIINVLVF